MVIVAKSFSAGGKNYDGKIIMSSKGKDRDYGDCEEIVDAVMDMIAKRWTKSMIKRELRDYFPGLSQGSAQWIITQAKRKICKIYNIDPQEYKGRQIAFYELILRGKDKTRDKLTAAERLDKLLGLEHISIEDPAEMAKKIVEFKRQAEKTVGGQGDGGSKDEGSRQDDGVRDAEIAGTASNETSPQEGQRESKSLGSVEDSGVTPEDPEIEANINDVLKKQSDPNKPKSNEEHE